MNGLKLTAVKVKAYDLTEGDLVCSGSQTLKVSKIDVAGDGRLTVWLYPLGFDSTPSGITVEQQRTFDCLTLVGQVEPVKDDVIDLSNVMPEMTKEAISSLVVQQEATRREAGERILQRRAAEELKAILLRLKNEGKVYIHFAYNTCGGIRSLDRGKEEATERALTELRRRGVNIETSELGRSKMAVIRA